MKVAYILSRYYPLVACPYVAWVTVGTHNREDCDRGMALSAHVAHIPMVSKNPDSNTKSIPTTFLATFGSLYDLF